MSGHYHDYDKGSSRSARDDSRASKSREGEKDWESRSKGSRSRSPKRKHSPPSSSRAREAERSRSRERDYDHDEKRSHKKTHSRSHKELEEEVPAPPPPPRISKITIGFSKPSAPIKMSIGAKADKPKPTVANVFNTDDDDEPEEMPAEAKMRMRNIGRETPTSAGPNSFGKTKQGFCDAKKVFEKNLKHALETQNKPPQMTKFPQTIYKINPSSS